MVAITSNRGSWMGALSLFLCVLAQASISSAKTPPFSDVSRPPMPSVPPLSFPPLPLLPKLPKFWLPPLPSQVPGFTVPGFSIPPEQPLKDLPFRFVPSKSVSLPEIPGINLPAKTLLPPLPSLRFPGFSYPPTPARTIKTPPFNPADLTIPGYTFHTVAVPPTSFPFPRRAAFPRPHGKN